MGLQATFHEGQLTLVRFSLFLRVVESYIQTTKIMSMHLNQEQELKYFSQCCAEELRLLKQIKTAQEDILTELECMQLQLKTPGPLVEVGCFLSVCV